MIIKYNCIICSKEVLCQHYLESADLSLCSDCYFDLDKVEWEQFMKGFSDLKF